VVVDEWAFLPNPSEAWASIEPVADAGGKIIGLSTANGSGNFFHHLWVGASTGNNLFNPMFFPWGASEDRDESWYESKRQSMLPWQLAQEYPSSAEEAFIKSGNPVFDLDVLQSMEIHIEAGQEGYLHELEPKVLEFRC
jgi:ADP-glucose pyrophosphorylase